MANMIINDYDSDSDSVLSEAETLITNIRRYFDIDTNSLHNICDDFINDDAVVIGMENDWKEYMVEEIEINLNKQQIKEALYTQDDVISVPVIQRGRGIGSTLPHDQDTNVYIAIYDYNIVISAKERFLYE